MRSARVSVAVLLASLLLTAAASSQVPSPVGNIYGTAVDEQERFLPSVRVTLTGPGAPQTSTTDAKGDFHFLNLPPSAYSITLERTGFETASRDVAVSLGKNAVFTVTMTVAAAAEAVTVSGEAPAMDSRKTETGATFERKELDTIPTTRDPWAFLRQVPGVLLTNMNVNGVLSGAVSTVFVGKGSHGDQNTYNLDGVAITIPDNSSSTPTSFDFGSLQDIEVVTGGSDPSLSTPGVSLNMVTRRGTNELKGSGRAFYFFPSSEGSQDQFQSYGGWDYGVEAGGPLWKDRVWLWAAGAHNNVPGQTFFPPDSEPVRQTSDLQFWNAKLNAQPAPANSLTLSYNYFDKIADGWGASDTRSQESTWHLTAPSSAYRIEDSQVLSEKLFASIYLSYLSSPLTREPEGGLDVQADYLNPGVWHNSNVFLRSGYAQHQAGMTASGFFDTGNLRHELKFGFGYNHNRVDSLSAWPGDGLYGDETISLAFVTRNANAVWEMNYYDAFVGDTVQTGNLTVNVGLRFDYQQGKNLPSSVPANPVFPELLPAVQYGGDAGYPITWRLFQPRVGATYALGADRKTLLRASYSRFVNRLNSEVVFVNAFPISADLVYQWNDFNGNHRVEPNEILPPLLGWDNVNPQDPASSAPVNQIAPNLKPPTTDEFIVGAEREIFSDLSASIAYTHRSSRNQEFFPLIGTTSSSYQYLGNATGTATAANGFVLHFSEPYYGLTTDPPPNGIEIQNRPDYKETYNGVELQVVKRLSHGWMLRASFAYNDWQKHVGPGAIVDPNNDLGGTNASGDVVQFGDGRGLGPIPINSEWQFNISGMVQLPLGIEASANFFGRQGFPILYFVRVFTNDTRGSTHDIQIGQVDAYRLPAVYQLDLNIQKPFRIGPVVTVTPMLGCFNVANSHTVLARSGRVGNWNSGASEPFTPAPPDSFNSVRQRLSDRTFRAGVQFSF